MECERGCLNKMESIGKRSSKNIQYPNEIERVSPAQKKVLLLNGGFWKLHHKTVYA